MTTEAEIVSEVTIAAAQNAPKEAEKPVEAVEVEEIQEVETAEEAEEEKEFDPKERVEITDPKVQAKLNNLYKQTKMSDARNKLMLDANMQLLSKVEELEKRFSQTDHAEAERILTSRLKEARAEGDEEKELKILNELVDYRADAKINQRVAKQKPTAEPIQADPEVRYVLELAEEKDDSGQVMRPWLNQSHPQFKSATIQAEMIGQRLFAENGEIDIPTVMQELDKAMAKRPTQRPQARQPDPMAGNLTNRNSAPKLKLSPDEAAICAKLGIKPEAYLANKPKGR